MLFKAPLRLLKPLSFLIVVLIITGCETPGNHITLVDVPSGQVAGVATERGVLVLKKPPIKIDDIYPIQHVFGSGVVYDEALVINANEYLALMKPISSNLYDARFLLTPLEEDDELFVGILDEESKVWYLEAELLERGRKGDLLFCDALIEYPKPSPDGYGGIGLFAYRNGSLWLAGILTTLNAEITGYKQKIYPFVSIDIIWDFLPDLKDNFTREIKPFRPDFIYGVERDGSGE